jgi:hypothetical protein
MMNDECGMMNDGFAPFSIPNSALKNCLPRRKSYNNI